MDRTAATGGQQVQCCAQDTQAPVGRHAGAAACILARVMSCEKRGCQEPDASRSCPVHPTRHFPRVLATHSSSVCTPVLACGPRCVALNTTAACQVVHP
jgi:hypothetical protein